MIPIWGVWSAIAVSGGLYVVSHVPKHPFETLGALPIAVVAGLLTAHTGSVVGAVLLHWEVAFLTATFATLRNPKVTMIWTGTASD